MQTPLRAQGGRQRQRQRDGQRSKREERDRNGRRAEKRRDGKGRRVKNRPVGGTRQLSNRTLCRREKKRFHVNRSPMSAGDRIWGSSKPRSVRFLSPCTCVKRNEQERDSFRGMVSRFDGRKYTTQNNNGTQRAPHAFEIPHDVRQEVCEGDKTMMRTRRATCGQTRMRAGGHGHTLA